MSKSLKLLRNSVCFVCTLFLLNSCSSPNGEAAKKEAAKEAPAFSTDTVIVKQMQFTPAVLTVKKGDTVIWINNDLVDHDVTSDESKKFYSDTLRVGKSWKWVAIDSAGYHCSIHPTMKGQILIK
jgi:plastocyanin